MADFSALSVHPYQTTGHHIPECIRLCLLSQPWELQVTDIMFAVSSELLQFTFSGRKFEAWNVFIVIIIFVVQFSFRNCILFFVAVLRIEASELSSGLLIVN